MTATGERLCRDSFPVEVYAPDVRDAPFRARVFITDSRVFVWADPAGTPELVIEAGHSTSVDRNRGSFYGQVTLDTDVGKVHVTKAGGCGCGSTLKALSPPVGW